MSRKTFLWLWGTLSVLTFGVNVANEDWYAANSAANLLIVVVDILSGAFVGGVIALVVAAIAHVVKRLEAD